MVVRSAEEETRTWSNPLFRPAQWTCCLQGRPVPPPSVYALSVEAMVASQLAVDFSLFDLPEADGAIALVRASSGRKRLLDPLPRGAHLGPRVDDGPLVLVILVVIQVGPSGCLSVPLDLPVRSSAHPPVPHVQSQAAEQQCCDRGSGQRVRHDGRRRRLQSASRCRR
eukprot:CAMPEP_0183413992 /NCGR_PEP_ID=MMETSP0370-20130417/22083_1 /TAXON_ID=268820 /ORGANISM="Peridinium aciculiferum, Strain PAER-2" /LENGTH=167 /DNA_ID=CAMNT_0025597265 /DNA_START=220 /DNA_END=719 /DNA_ORIENTATION=-